jgi:hypothetical protein
MAATAESVVAASPGGSRWTAVSVALEGSEAAISLDHEMQKAHDAFAAADSASARVPEAESVSAANSSAPAPTAVESPAGISSAEPTTAFAESKQKPAPVAEPAGAQESQPRPESEFVATAASNSTVPLSAPREEDAAEKPAAEAAPEPKFDSETVKNTAAAWATWRQVHDSSQSNQVAEPQPKEIDQPESAPPEAAARAVAAGAEQISQEALAAAAADGDQSNVASIVDSVLADLRPKLMEEINRKMSKKK